MNTRSFSPLTGIPLCRTRCFGTCLWKTPRLFQSPDGDSSLPDEHATSTTPFEQAMFQSPDGDSSLPDRRLHGNISRKNCTGFQSPDGDSSLPDINVDAYRTTEPTLFQSPDGDSSLPDRWVGG